MADFAHTIGIRLGRAQKFAFAVGWRFYRDGCLMRASALAYTSLLSLVPLLALMFAGLKGLGVQRRLEPLLLSRLALTPEVANQIVTYIDRTNVSTLGALGAAALVLTVISVLGSIEATLNHIWRVRRNRTFWRKATHYLGAVLLTPFLLLAAVVLTSSVEEQALLHWALQTEYVGGALVQVLALAPIAINSLALGILYAVMPNRRPHLPSLMIASVVAGCAWYAVQWSYIALQIGVARYNAIYGALSQLPVTLVWIYLIWLVVLAGAELAAVCEFGAESADPSRAAPSRWAVAMHLLLRAAERFRDGDGGIDLRRVARELRVDESVVFEVTDKLRSSNLLVAVEGAPTYVLGRAPSAIELASLDALVDSAAIPPGCDARVKAVLGEWTAECRSAWKHRRLGDLVG